jgi:hypothetical protein
MDLTPVDVGVHEPALMGRIEGSARFSGQVHRPATA